MTKHNIPDLVRILTDQYDLPDKSQRELDKILLKWFSSQIVKSLKLPTLQEIYARGSYDVFEDLLRAAGDVERIAVLNKIDKYRPEIQMRTAGEALAHLRKLAAGEMLPAAKPPTLTKRKASAKKKPSPRGILTNSKY
jgi:hypothetical protein